MGGWLVCKLVAEEFGVQVFSFKDNMILYWADGEVGERVKLQGFTIVVRDDPELNESLS